MKKFSLLVASFILFSSVNAIAAEVNSKPSEVARDQEVVDPDLKLSIEELRKKYPIGWMEEKFGVIDNKNCVTADSYDINEVDSWPCGPICYKNPNNKKCPKSCYKHMNGISDNLVCSFFKEVYDGIPNDKNGWVSRPVARFEDFSIEEIKSAFVNYFDVYQSNDKDIGCSVFKGYCYRSGQVAAITFIHLLKKENNLLDAKERMLKNFIFSKKVTKFRRSPVRGEEQDKCKSFVKDFLKPSIPSLTAQDFCSNFYN